MTKREYLDIHEDESFINIQDYKELYTKIFGDIDFA